MMKSPCVYVSLYRFSIQIFISLSLSLCKGVLVCDPVHQSWSTDATHTETQPGHVIVRSISLGFAFLHFD